MLRHARAGTSFLSIGAEDERVTLTVDDGEVVATASVPADVVRSSPRCGVNGQLLGRLARSLPADELTAELNGDRLLIASGRTRFEIFAGAPGSAEVVAPTEGV